MNYQAQHNELELLHPWGSINKRNIQTFTIDQMQGTKMLFYINIKYIKMV